AFTASIVSNRALRSTPLIGAGSVVVISWFLSSKQTERSDVYLIKPTGRFCQHVRAVPPCGGSRGAPRQSLKSRNALRQAAACTITHRCLLCGPVGLKENQGVAKKGEMTRERIVAESERLILNQGFAGTSLSDILAATGLTKGAFF